MSTQRDQLHARLRQTFESGPWRLWFQGKDFSEDWSSPYFPLWMKVLASAREQPLDVLEIGSFEGRSAIFWLEYLKNCKVTCIDHFATTKKRNGAEMERRFDLNTATYAGRITKIKASSVGALAALIEDRKAFDLIYIDGCHHRDAVFVDAALSWQLVKLNGFIIFDDYAHELERNSAERPKDAIDCFLEWHRDEYTEIARGYQIIIQKTVS